MLRIRTFVFSRLEAIYDKPDIVCRSVYITVYHDVNLFSS
jgi:hypothetical protein